MSRSYKRLLSAVGNHFFVRAVLDLTTYKIEKQQAEHEIQAGKANQCEDGVAVAHHFALAVARAKKAID